MSPKKMQTETEEKTDINIFPLSRIFIRLNGLYFNDRGHIQPRWMRVLQRMHLCLMKSLFIMVLIVIGWAFLTTTESTFKVLCSFMFTFYILLTYTFFEGSAKFPEM